MPRRDVALVALAMLFLAGTTAARADDHRADAELGRGVYANLVDTGQIVEDSPYAAVLQRVGKRIVAASGKHWFTERFFVVRSNQLNAFSAPGGFVFVNEGLLQNTDNVDELANVLGHETAHLVLGHVTARNDVQQKTDLAAKVSHLFVHSEHAQRGYDVANGAVHYGFLNFSRDQEFAADVTGADLAAKAGFNPWGTVWFLQTLEHLDGDAGFEQYVQHHPSTGDRIAHIEKHLTGEPETFGHYRRVAASSAGLPVSGKL